MKKMYFFDEIEDITKIDGLIIMQSFFTEHFDYLCDLSVLDEGLQNWEIIYYHHPLEFQKFAKEKFDVEIVYDSNKSHEDKMRECDLELTSPF